MIWFPSFSFNVKVLLDQTTVAQLHKKKWILGAPHGFVVSDVGDQISGHFLPEKTCTISAKNGFILSGKSLYNKRLQIDPLLDPADQHVLQQYIHQHVRQQAKALQRHEYLRFDDFKKFIVKKDEQYSTGIRSDIFAIMRHVILDFHKKLGSQPVISLEKLKHRFVGYIDSKIIHQIETHIEQYRKTKQKKLLRKKDFIRKLYQDVVVCTAQKLLFDFITALPQRVLRNYFQRDCGWMSFDGNKYLGSFILVQEGQQVMLINSVPIQDYIISVLRTEGWPGWSVEVNKVLAVACRTYLLAKVMQARAKKLPYHIKNSIVHQTYKGHHTFTKLHTAVNATDNLFLAYNGKPIEAMFDSCCGGIVPAHITGYDFKNHPYLKRSEKCTFCKPCKIATWKATYSMKDLQNLLRFHGYRIGPITDIKVTKKDKAGVVQEVTVFSKKKLLKIPGKKIYNWLPEVKSFCYTISKMRGKKYIFSGKGYGHHIGLCQWGAMRMVHQGYDFKRVLQFYYPGATFMQFKELL